MPRIPKEITKQLQIEANKGKDFTVGGIRGFKCDYRRTKPCYYLQWNSKGKKYTYYLNTTVLKEAREQARKIRDLIDKGLDPNEIRRAEKLEHEALEAERKKQDELFANTLRKVSKECFEDYKNLGIWKGKDKGQHEIERFNSAILPELGDIPITEITSQKLYEHFKQYWTATPNQADKVYTRLNLVFNWAIARGTYHININPADKRGPFGVLIQPLTIARKKSSNLPAPDYRRMPELLKECLTAKSISSIAFIFQVLTATRGEAVRTLKWSDIELKEALAVIRPENDKASKEFGESNRPREIYLSNQAIELLKSIPRLGDFVFISRQGFNQPLGEWAISEFLKGIHEAKKAKDGIGWVDRNVLDKKGNPKRIVPHATARAAFRTWAEEHHKHEKASELCLLHLPKDIYGGAYKRGLFEKERREIMQQWADFCLQKIDLKELFG